jgi:hypothetical protein
MGDGLKHKNACLLYTSKIGLIDIVYRRGVIFGPDFQTTSTYKFYR